ncbi:hypothetical protein GGX14DRAFT_558628 [Mycena pura]|uniref:Uncharacterized protein n=1 Tax=Mycena pura TaxID=153505 RepID=A0AAD7E0E3_9AGAR|nr:hypothetical protein GGX14DRAFT_558628 [Mycena pura]
MARPSTVGRPSSACLPPSAVCCPPPLLAVCYVAQDPAARFPPALSAAHVRALSAACVRAHACTPWPCAVRRVHVRAVRHARANPVHRAWPCCTPCAWARVRPVRVRPLSATRMRAPANVAATRE